MWHVPVQWNSICKSVEAQKPERATELSVRLERQWQETRQGCLRDGHVSKAYCPGSSGSLSGSKKHERVLRREVTQSYLHSRKFSLKALRGCQQSECRIGRIPVLNPH